MGPTFDIKYIQLQYILLPAHRPDLLHCKIGFRDLTQSLVKMLLIHIDEYSTSLQNTRVFKIFQLSLTDIFVEVYSYYVFQQNK